jgi:ADP-ribose pyrophosphatase YjhB (NUDIX family)
MEQKLTSPYAVVAVIVSPQGIPLVKDPKKPSPYWKLPGGRSEEKETPTEAIIREIKEEIGLSFKPKDMELIYEEEREGHNFYLFQTNPLSLEGLKTKGNEGEEVKLFLPEQIKSLPDFFPPHRKILEEIKFLKT